MKQELLVACGLIVASLIGTTCQMVRGDIWYYEDDFETDKAMYESWHHSEFVDEVPMIHFVGVLHYEVGVAGRGLGFYEGYMPDTCALLGYEALPSESVCSAGFVMFDLAGWGTMFVVEWSEGVNWTTLGSLTVVGEPETLLLPIDPGSQMQFVEFWGCDAPQGHPTMDNMMIMLNYVWRGDLDESGSIGLEDIEPFVSVVLGLDNDPLHKAIADMNADSLANSLDIQLFVEALLVP